jgi:hypothetical protein
MRDGRLIEQLKYDQSVGDAAPGDVQLDVDDVQLDVDDATGVLRPLTGEARDRVEAALRQRPGDRDVILSTVEANGFDIGGL